MVGALAAVQIAVGVVAICSTFGGLAYRFVLKPIKQTAERAESKAETAKSTGDDAMATARAAEETAEDIGDRIDDKLDRIEENQIEQQREARARSFYLRQVTEAIKQSSDIEADKLPTIEQDDFLRGGGRGDD